MGLLSPLSHMPLQTATKDGLSGSAAGPPRHFPSQASRPSHPLPELWHLPLNHSSSFAYHRPLSLPFSGSHSSFERNSSNYLGFNSGAILICLNVTSIFLPWRLLTGHKVGSYLGSPASHSALNCQHPTFLIFWISFFLYSFLPFLSVNSITCSCSWQCLLHSPKDVPFLLLMYWEEHKLSSQTDLYSDAKSYVSVLFASAVKWGY